METSVEISMYPLKNEFVVYIKEFIEKLKKNPKLIVETNGMSTQIFGDYFEIMNTLTAEMHQAFLEAGKSIFVLKIVNAFLKQ